MISKLVVLTGTIAMFVLSPTTATGQLPEDWEDPQCDLKVKHFLVKNARAYLEKATRETKDEGKRMVNLADAHHSLSRAAAEGEAENPALWYFYGRYYLLTDDAFGADSAFTKAEAQVPDCKNDIEFYRRVAWVPVIQQAAELMNVGDLESAKDAFRRANALYRDESFGLYYLANVFTDEGQADSAIYYYERTVPLVEGDSTSVETYELSLFNLARLNQQQENWQEAGKWYDVYLAVRPDDTSARLSLAIVHEGAGDSAAALSAYDDILAQAPTLGTEDLFRVGIALFQSQQLPRAVAAFQSVLRQNCYFRDALFNLSSTYLSMGSTSDTTISQEERDAASKVVGDKMLPVTKRLAEIDGYNRNSLRMLAIAYQYVGEPDSVYALLQMVDSLPFEVNVSEFEATELGYNVEGTVTNLREEPISIPALTFEFLDGEGNTVARDSVEVGMLDPEGSQQFQISPSADGIVSWRYKPVES